jgi:flagellar basal-body rod protein FlgC
MNITRGPDGKPYQRQQVVFEALLQQQMAGDLETLPQTVKLSRIEKSSRPPKLIHNPGHPHADANGMVAMPDINLFEEMVDLIASTRAFEANLAVMKNARSMALQTFALGKRT